MNNYTEKNAIKNEAFSQKCLLHIWGEILSKGSKIVSSGRGRREKYGEGRKGLYENLNNERTKYNDVKTEIQKIITLCNGSRNTLRWILK